MYIDDNALRLAAGTSGNGFLSASMLLEEMRIAYKGIILFLSYIVECCVTFFI